MLYLTSFGLGLGAVCAMSARERLVGSLCSALYGTSVLHHAKLARTDYPGGRIIAPLDRALAKVNFVVLAWKASRLRKTPGTLGVWVSMAAMPVIYYAKVASGRKYEENVVCTCMRWHAAMHFIATAGLMLYSRETWAQGSRRKCRRFAPPDQ